MDIPNLDELRIINPDVRAHLSSGRIKESQTVATGLLGDGLSDVALTELVAGQYQPAVMKLRDALNICPSSQTIFHNLAAALLKGHNLRRDNLNSLQEFIYSRWQQLPWVQQYRRLLYMPRFININFVQGKCNLRCRMCGGVQSPNYPDRLTYMSADNFRQTLEVAPTAASATLSSGNSEPLLHPELERIITIAREHQFTFDMFTNGLPLNARRCRLIVESQVFNMINFSMDAATPETYRAIRGADFHRLIRNIEMLEGMRKELGLEIPRLSLSLVAMQDNIQDLPELVALARRYNAMRVYVEALNGWHDDAGGNHPATANPRCFEYVREARRRAAEANLHLQLPALLVQAERSETPADNKKDTVPPRLLPCCSWLGGVLIWADGRLDPCCLVGGVADMGTIHDGPLLKNDKYARVKELLLQGKVFQACAKNQNCEYVQQQLAAGKKLRIITREELGDLSPDAQRKCPTPACV